MEFLHIYNCRTLIHLSDQFINLCYLNVSTLDHVCFQIYRNCIVNASYSKPLNAYKEKIKSKGQAIEISSPYRIKIPRADYIEVVKESCEFSIYKEEEMGKQLVLSYLKREVTQPQYEDSDKEGMITVDMKTIPPQTPVNFDAFIYLPRNKRLVRYLKDGRCLSLKQVKRHIEEEVPCKLYIPKKDKPKLIQFFIENTIGWEFISHTTEDKKVS